MASVRVKGGTPLKMTGPQRRPPYASYGFWAEGMVPATQHVFFLAKCGG